MGNSKTTQQVEEIRRQIDTAIRKKNVAMAKELLDVMVALDMVMARVNYFRAWIAEWHRDFDITAWKNPAQARQLINRGL